MNGWNDDDSAPAWIDPEIFKRLPKDVTIYMLKIVEDPQRLLQARLLSKEIRDSINCFVVDLVNKQKQLKDAYGEPIAPLVIGDNLSLEVAITLITWSKGLCSLTEEVDKRELVANCDKYFSDDNDQLFTVDDFRGMQSVWLANLESGSTTGSAPDELINQKKRDLYIRALLASGRLAYTGEADATVKDQPLPITTKVNAAIALWGVGQAYWKPPVSQ
jgi:hypothetical protein